MRHCSSWQAPPPDRYHVPTSPPRARRHEQRSPRGSAAGAPSAGSRHPHPTPRANLPQQRHPTRYATAGAPRYGCADTARERGRRLRLRTTEPRLGVRRAMGFVSVGPAPAGVVVERAPGRHGREGGGRRSRHQSGLPHRRARPPASRHTSAHVPYQTWRRLPDRTTPATPAPFSPARFPYVGTPEHPRARSFPDSGTSTSCVRMWSAIAHPGQTACGDLGDGREVERLRAAGPPIGDVADVLRVPLGGGEVASDLIRRLRCTGRCRR